MRIRNVKNKEEILNNSKFLVHNYKNNCGNWNKIFKNNNPIYIEIGMGKGKFIIENAKKYKDINFIGIERFDSILAKALPKIDEDIDNLLIIRMNALEIDEVFDKEIDRIYLNFSDPWPKVRHHNRRLTSEIFLNKYDKIFKKKNEIYLRTDNEDLYKYSIETLSHYKYSLYNVTFDLHKDKKDLITTEYEDKFSKNNMPIYALCAIKEDV